MGSVSRPAEKETLLGRGMEEGVGRTEETREL